MNKFKRLFLIAAMLLLAVLLVIGLSNVEADGRTQDIPIVQDEIRSGLPAEEPEGIFSEIQDDEDQKQDNIDDIDIEDYLRSDAQGDVFIDVV